MTEIFKAALLGQAIIQYIKYMYCTQNVCEMNVSICQALDVWSLLNERSNHTALNKINLNVRTQLVYCIFHC